MPFPSHLAMSIGFFVGIIPSVILVFLTLQDYDEYYEDKHFFFLLVVGLFAGIMTALFYYWSIYYLNQNLTIITLILIIVGLALFEMLLLSIILSMKRFGFKYDLTYYGVVLGGSIAGVLGMFIVYLYLNNLELSSQAILSIALMTPTLPMLYISLGALMGFGLYSNNFLKYASWVVVLKMLFNILFIFWFIALLFWTERGWDLMIIGLVFANILYFYVTRNHLPLALPEHLKKHKRRTKRKRKQK